MDGILPLWKEKGMTSHDCVFKLRKILGMKKIGHTGTLDPNVDGVLPICLGKGTKLVDLLMDKSKLYTGEITLGFATDTEDLDGQIIDQAPLTKQISADKIDQAMLNLQGDIEQIPPMYSAVKVNGRRLYDYARNNEEVERPVRHVRIDYFKRTSEINFDKDSGYERFNFAVKCGKGTYIRTLATDLGRSLGLPATMTQLTRQGSSPFASEDCLTLDQVQAAFEQGNIDKYLWSIDQALSQYPKWEVSENLVHLVENGAVLASKQFPLELQDSRAFALTIKGQVKALYGPHPSKPGQMKPIKMF